MQIQTNKWQPLHTLRTYHGDIDIISEKYYKVMLDQENQKEVMRRLVKNDERIFTIYPDCPSEWYPIDFDFEFREYIRDKFGRKCFLCSTHEQDCNARLSVHHVDYDKRSLNIYNFVPLCLKCHAKTNHDRAYWESQINNKLFLFWLGFGQLSGWHD